MSEHDELVEKVARALREAGRMRAALSDLLAGCIEEYGEPDEGAADESVGWDGTGKPMPFTYGLMQRARAALEPATLKALDDGVLAYDKSEALHRSKECNEVAFTSAIDAFLSSLAASGFVVVPREATEEMCDEVRGLLMTEFSCSPKYNLGAVLEAMGRLPRALTEEERALTHIPPKRWRAAMLYRCMIAAASPQPHSNHNQD